MKRSIDQSLLTWKASTGRKVLLLRGARQVGKTYSARELGKSFDSVLEVNFYEQPKVKQFFSSGSLDPKAILEKLGAYYEVSVVKGRTLLFLDEIQDCPEALSSLRFFYEKLPDLHVIAAGSLLEFVISEIPSFGVGRVESIFMYPLTFSEFLEASENSALLQMIGSASENNPLELVFHEKCLSLLRTFMLIGGLPEVVAAYLNEHDIVRCSKLITSLILSYEDDFAKYKKRANLEKLQETFRSISQQAGGKFVFSRVNLGGSSYGYLEALNLLARAGLAYKVLHSSANGIPLGAEVNQKKFKVLPFDVGVYHRLLGLNLDSYLTSDNIQLVNEGATAEVFAGLEILAHASNTNRPELFYWHREARNSNAELDYIIQEGSAIVPIEVKAGTKGQMQSLYRFLDEKKRNRGIRLSLENFASYDKVSVIPLYALSELRRLVA